MLKLLYFPRDLHEGAPTVPALITEFVDVMRDALRNLTDRTDLALDVKANFLRHARHTFGRTALVLSGGGALGCFHIVRRGEMSAVQSAGRCFGVPNVAVLGAADH